MLFSACENANTAESGERSMVDLEVDDGLAVITIDRPHARNAISLETMDQLDEALDGADGRGRAGDHRRRRQGLRLRRRPQGTQRPAHRGARRRRWRGGCARSATGSPASPARCWRRSTATPSAAAPRSPSPPTSGWPPTTSRSASTRWRWRSCPPGAAPSGWSSWSATAGPCCWRAPDASSSAADAERIGLIDQVVPRASFDDAVARCRPDTGDAPAGEIKRVMRGVPTTEAVAAFARLWVADEHWAAADKVMNKGK